MWENVDIDRHYTGVFQILDEPISGELIYNKQNGTKRKQNCIYRSYCK